MDDVAVITGGASGFGLALGGCCAELGLRVALLDLDGARASEEAAALSERHGVEVLGAAVDVSQAASVEVAAATVQDRFGRVDLVISNVGVQLFGSVERLTDEEWQWVLNVNVVGAARTARAFLPMLRRSENPRIAFTTSSSVLSPGSRMAVYQASKFALWGLAETLRLELEPEGIAVSVVFPSGMITRHLETSEAAQPDSVGRTIGEAEDFEVMVASNPGMTADVVMPDDAARGAIHGVLSGTRYVVTHGDLVGAIAERAHLLTVAAELARGDATG